MTPTPQLAAELLRYIPPRPDYDTWTRIVSAVGNSFGEGEALSLLLNHFGDEKPGETRRKLHSRMKSISFGTLVYYATSAGWKPEPGSIKERRAPQTVRKYQAEKKTTIDGEAPIYRLHFADEIHEERAALYEYDAKMTREAAERKVLERHPKAEHTRERLYRLSVNNSVLDKSQDYVTLNSRFENVTLTLSQIAKAIKAGHALCACQFKTKNGRISRNNESWSGSEIVLLDLDYSELIDGVKTRAGNYRSIGEFLQSELASKAALVYTTVSSSDTWERYRVLIELPRFITNATAYKTILQKFITLFGADQARSDLSGIHSGNRAATIYNLTTGEVTL